MTDRDRRYNASEKGKARDRRREKKKARKKYKREWLRAYRQKKARPVVMTERGKSQATGRDEA